MKATGALSLITAVGLALAVTCAAAQPRPGTGGKLPPQAQLKTVGTWQLDDSCTGRIIDSGATLFWSTFCTVATGHGNGDGGIALGQLAPGHYTAVGFTLTILPDGSLMKRVPGRPDEIAKPILSMAPASAAPACLPAAIDTPDFIAAQALVSRLPELKRWARSHKFPTAYETASKAVLRNGAEAIPLKQWRTQPDH
jgi:hypothetical protein